MTEHKSADQQLKDAACAPLEPRVTLINAGCYVVKVEAYDIHPAYNLSILGLGLPGLMVTLNEAQANRLIEALS